MADPTPIFSADQVNQDLTGVVAAGVTAPIAGAANSALSSGVTALAGSVSGPIGGALAGALSGALSGGLSGGLNGALSGALAGLLGSVIKAPVAGSAIPNPMHQYASWTYATSLWWLDINDYNALIDSGDAGTGTTTPLLNSYVIAEDSGLYPDRRLPTQRGLNYNIQTIDFNTVVGLNSTSKSSNMTDGTLTIAEPYGVTLLDTLVKADTVLNPSGKSNYLQQPYMLQIDFVGYDDAGNQVPASQTSIYRKRFPINIREFKIQVSNRGAEYALAFTAAGHEAHADEVAKIPKNITVTAKTVGEFFDATLPNSFTSQLNKFLQQEVTDKKAESAHSYKFDIDSSIASSKIVYDKQMSLSQANPNASSIDLSTGNFSIASGTSIQEIINKVLIQSDYLIGQLGLDLQSSTPDQVQTSMTQVLNTYKTVVQTTYAGTSAAGVTTNGVFDSIRNIYPKVYTYNIHQYSVYDAKHPAAPLLTDSRPYTSKAYSYIYTGHNIDILDLNIHFDATFFTAVNAYTSSVAATQPTASIGLDTVLASGPAISLSSALMGALNLIPNFGSIQNLTPLRYKNIVNDQRDNTGMNIIANPAAQTTANLMRSVYSELQGDMQNLELTIVGDPTLLKQDDWLYSPSPTTSTNWLAEISQSDFAQQYGHIKMDNGDLIASVTINTPVDIDIDQTNKGLMTPTIGTVPSLFSGQYIIKTIKNTFTGGTFTQVLSMIRLSNDALVAAGGAPNTGRGAVGTSQLAQGLVNSAVQTLGGLVNTGLGAVATAASDLYNSATGNNGQATLNSSGAVDSAYDATRWGEG